MLNPRPPISVTIPCLSTGRSLTEVLLLLSITSSYNPTKPAEYAIKSRRTGDVNADPVTPGTYSLARLDTTTAPTTKTTSNLHLIPSIADTPTASLPGTPTSESVAEMCEQSTPVDATKLNDLLRTIAFSKALFQRDRVCIVSGVHAISHLEASHVVPFGWIKRLDLLPDEIALAVRLNGGIDSVRNGILLKISLSMSFDRGEWGIVEDGDGQFRAFAINGDALRLNINGQSLHGLVIKTPAGEVSAGVTYKDLFPPEIFFQFHFGASVLKFCARDGEDHVADATDDEDMRPVLASEDKLREFVDDMAVGLHTVRPNLVGVSARPAQSWNKVA